MAFCLTHSINSFKSLAGMATSGTCSHSPRNYDKAGVGESGRKKKNEFNVTPFCPTH